MSLLSFVTDTAGDFFHTSKLARLNDSMFGPTLGTRIRRSEWDQCKAELTDVKAPNILHVLGVRSVTKKEMNPSTSDGNYNRQQFANNLLTRMQDEGTKFSENRLYVFVNNLQTKLGYNPIAHVTDSQLDTQGRQRLHNQLRVQRSIR